MLSFFAQNNFPAEIYPRILRVGERKEQTLVNVLMGEEGEEKRTFKAPLPFRRRDFRGLLLTHSFMPYLRGKINNLIFATWLKMEETPSNLFDTRELPGVALVNCAISHIFTIIQIKFLNQSFLFIFPCMVPHLRLGPYLKREGMYQRSQNM